LQGVPCECYFMESPKNPFKVYLIIKPFEVLEDIKNSL